MSISQDGKRARYYAERKKVEAQQGKPVHEDVSYDVRRRIAREVVANSGFRDSDGNWIDFRDWLNAELNRVFLRKLADRFSNHNFDEDVANLSLDNFLQALEIFAQHFLDYRKDAVVQIDAVQSLLADDLSIFRIVDTGKGNKPRFQVQRIDNKHLHTVVTDRTFELTTIAEFASAQNDYADAWRAYSKGETDVALTDAHKAVESACKAILKKLDPNSTPDNMQFGPLITELVRLKVIPQEMNHISGQLEQIFRGSGSLRNQAGAAHGSLDPTSPESSVALLGLRLSGTLIAFLAERWLQMK